MQRKDFVAVAAAGALGVFASTHPAKADAPPIAASGEATGGTKPLDDFVVGAMRTFELPCGALAVAKDGRLVYARAFGTQDLAGKIQATPRDRFRIASSSKPFTAVAIMQLIEAGKLHLDDRAFDILTTFAPPNGRQVDPRLRTITVRNLLEHSAGFDSTKTDPQFDALRTAADALGKPRPATHDDIIEYMMGQPLAFDPGSKYLYSNLGYNILGRIVERLTGTSYEAALKARVLAPAGITRMAIGKSKRKDIFPDEVEAWDPPTFTAMYSVFEDQDEVVPYSYGGFSMETIDAHGGWVASVVDLTRFLNAVGGTGRAAVSTRNGYADAGETRDSTVSRPRSLVRVRLEHRTRIRDDTQRSDHVGDFFDHRPPARRTHVRALLQPPAVRHRCVCRRLGEERRGRGQSRDGVAVTRSLFPVRLTDS